MSGHLGPTIVQGSLAVNGSFSIGGRTFTEITKESLGLGNVNNWVATAAVDDASDTKYATAGAVKKAYDLAAGKITKAQGDSYYLGKTAAAEDSKLLGGASKSMATSINSIPQRDSSGDINARLFRSEYANGSAIGSGAALAFRNNNTSDNYIRFTNNKQSVLDWLGALSATASDNRFLPKSYLTNRTLADANSPVTDGVHVGYLATAATNRPTGTDHALLTMNYSNAWSVQMAGDWRTNRWYVRNQNSSVWGSWAELYSTVNKPTKADVGLSNVYNWSATGSVSNSSDTVYATAGAVKKAYDLAASKITKAQGDGYYLGKTAKAADSELLDGLDSTKFVRADTNRIALKPSGGNYQSTEASETCAFKIKLPLHKSSTMLKIRGSVFNYLTNETFEFFISGYTYASGTWVNPSAYMVGGTKEIKVRFCMSDTETYILLGDDDSVWKYPHIHILSVEVGYGARNEASHWQTGWEISKVTASVAADVNSTLTMGRIYTTQDRPTKGDIGLGNVNNWAATSAVNSTSTTTYATAKGVKDAYDRASSALTTAQAALPKAGGTMSGMLKAHVGLEVSNGLRILRTPTSANGDDVVTINTDDGGMVVTVDNDNDADSGNVTFKYMSAGAAHNTLAFSPTDITFKGNAIYHAGRKPTKADVGLSAVNNWGATSATNSTSTTTYATAAGVKAAYDLAQSAKGDLSNVFLKTGGDITGNVSINRTVDALLSVDVSANKNATFRLSEDSKQHGFYIHYDGVSSNKTFFGTTNAGTDAGFAEIARGSRKLNFLDTPTVLGNNVYHVGNKPSKADVGLSNVNNWSASSSTSSSSTSVYATSAAVKSAYDLAASKMTQSTGDGRYAYKNLQRGVAQNITVAGDANTFYPVLFSNLNYEYGLKRFSVSRGYNWAAPAWNTSTHKGGCSCTVEWTGDSRWGGNSKTVRLLEWTNQYTEVLGGFAYAIEGIIVWLRGGGAQYRIVSDYGDDINVVAHMNGFTAGDDAVYPVKTLAQAVTGFADAHKYLVMRGNEIYDKGNRVFSESNHATPAQVGLPKLADHSQGLGILNNGKWSYIGSRNSSYCHYSTDASSGHYFYGSVTASNGFNALGTGSGQGLAFNGKTAIGGANDGWLRVNPTGQFVSGIYCGNVGVLRHDNEIQCGADSANKSVRIRNNFYDTTWGGNGVSAYGARCSDSSGAHWLLASYYDASNIRAGIMVLSNSEGRVRIYTNRRSKFVEINGGEIFNSAGAKYYSSSYKPTPADIGAATASHNHNDATMTTMYFTNWVRAKGNTGIYFQDHGGGWYMTDSTWIRNYGSKPVLVTGNIAATGDIIGFYSDRRLKENIRALTGGMDIIRQWNAVRYNANQLAHDLAGYDMSKQEIGLIAQEVEKTTPELVSRAAFDLGEDMESVSGENYLTINYAKTTPVLVAGLQEVDATVQEQQRVISSQERRISELEAKLSDMESKLNKVLAAL